MSPISFCKDIPRWIKEIPGHLKTQNMCLEAVRIEPFSLAYVPDDFKTEEMCNDAVEKDPYRQGMYQSATGRQRCVKRSLSVSLVSYARP